MSDATTAVDARPLLELQGVVKRFGPVTALADGTLCCRPGSIHAVMGENGAGKSTLIKIMAGVLSPTEGIMRLDGREIAFSSPAEAQRHGVVCVFQELSLMPDLSVADNIGITAPPRRWGLIDRGAQLAEARRLLRLVGCDDIDGRERVRDLPLSRRQMVEIAKALGRKPRLLILDEATSALTADDVGRVVALLKRLRAEGMCILYISHRMHEIRELADECSVFANGRHVASFPFGSRTEDEIVRMMIGRPLSQMYPPKPPAPRVAPAPLLEARRLGWENRLRDVSLGVAAGEIVGLGGLDGQGQREFLLALFGCLSGVTGEIVMDGSPVSPRGPRTAKADPMRLALVPEDRKTEGLMLPMTVAENLSAATLSRWRRGPLIDNRRERQAIEEMQRRMQIKAVLDLPVATLSGGNQQKVAIGKWLMLGPRVLLLCDPTRGIDVGTKQEIYRLLRELADAGTAVLLYTTDYDELIGLCDRVAIFRDGHVVRTLEGDGITEEAILSGALAMGGADHGTERAA
ncbi:sugar ABC transporter ATP-binding protein [Rhizosaccharibacter radicis]|uniref:Sugar ABC transporter ATP-binding protein n=1 Tax=Rhizosaccharibacter radicis TaxID=2782605 RepID=A0ABT1VVM5_9PROT|nr:sugar ABC transporter ATP-binding protein [Acetobacteraceae bacterium KSS12]